MTGGTLGATHSMIRALPDCEHLVYAFTSQWGEEAKAAFGDKVRLEAGLSREACAVALRDWKADLIVFQNTSPDRMPNDLGDAETMFYAHSALGSLKESRERCKHTFVVSNWLADKIGVDRSKVLLQPVEAPPETAESKERTRGLLLDSTASKSAGDGGLRLAGRIATPNRHKWDQADYMPWIQAAKDAEPRLMFEPVGGTGPSLPWILKGHTGYGERWRVRNWDYMISACRVEESYGRTVCEAQRAGCVPIVNRKGGFVEQINHGVDGFLVDTPADVAAAVKQLADDDVLAQFKQAAKAAGDARGSLKRWRKDFLTRIQAE